MTGAPSRAPASSTTLWSRDRGFQLFWTGQTLSTMGDSFTTVAVPLLALQTSPSVASLGLITAAGAVGGAVGIVLGAILVDRSDLRRLLIVVEVLRAATCAAVPLAMLLALAGAAVGVRLAVLAIAMGALGCLGLLFELGRNRLMPLLVPIGALAAASGRLQATASVAAVVGTALAGLSCRAFGPGVALVGDGVSFAVSCLTLRAIRLPPRAAARADGDEAAARSPVAGLRFLLRHSTLCPLMLLVCAIALCDVCVQDLFIYTVKERLRRSDITVGLVFSAASVGAIAGGLLVGRLRERLGVARCWLVMVAIEAAVLVAAGSAGSLAALIPLAMVFMGCKTVQAALAFSIRVELTPHHLVGRVAAAFWMLMSTSEAIGAISATSFARHFGTPMTFRVLGLAIAGVCVTGIVILSRRPIGVSSTDRERMATSRTPAARTSRR